MIICVWNNLEVECSQGIFEKEITLGSSINVPICSVHLDHHEKLMALYAAGKDMEDIIDMTKEEMNKELSRL